MSSNLEQLKSRVKGNPEVSVASEFYFLAKELGCLPDLLGREYDVEYEEIKIWKFKWHRISKIIQKPISVSAFKVLMGEMKKDYDHQKKQMKKGKRGK